MHLRSYANAIVSPTPPSTSREAKAKGGAGQEAKADDSHGPLGSRAITTPGKFGMVASPGTVREKRTCVNRHQPAVTK